MGCRRSPFFFKYMGTTLAMGQSVGIVPELTEAHSLTMSMAITLQPVGSGSLFE